MTESMKGIGPDEALIGETKEDAPVNLLMEQVLAKDNLKHALHKVIQNKGAPGIDGMSVNELPEYLRHHWPRLKAQLLKGRY